MRPAERWSVAHGSSLEERCAEVQFIVITVRRIGQTTIGQSSNMTSSKSVVRSAVQPCSNEFVIMATRASTRRSGPTGNCS